MVKVTKEVKDLLDAQNATINLLKSQLQAKTDECEELRDKNKRQTLTVIDLSTMNKCLIDECKNCTKDQENTALKQQLDTAVEALEQAKIDLINIDMIIDSHLDSSSECYKKFVKDYYAMQKKIKTALDKVKN